jgi:hypothetical protein
MLYESITLDEITNDLLNLQKELPDNIIHIGLFGSVLQKTLREVGDIDVLILYDGITFDVLKKSIRKKSMLLSTYEAYLNVSYIKSQKMPGDPAGYHMILMPIHNPCWNFIERNKGRVSFITEPFKPLIDEKRDKSNERKKDYESIK